MRCGDRCAGGLSTEGRSLFDKVISPPWWWEKWLFALIGGSVALLGHGLLKLLIALGCAATIANVVQAPLAGWSVAYWSLLVVGGAVNSCSDKYWSFSPDPSGRPRHAAHRPRVGRRLLGLLLGALLVGLSAVLFTDAFILVAATTLTFQLYKWWRPEHNDPNRYGEPDAPPPPRGDPGPDAP